MKNICYFMIKNKEYCCTFAKEVNIGGIYLIDKYLQYIIVFVVKIK